MTHPSVELLFFAQVPVSHKARRPFVVLNWLILFAVEEGYSLPLLCIAALLQTGRLDWTGLVRLDC